jgi:hypothetical protein
VGLAAGEQPLHCGHDVEPDGAAQAAVLKPGFLTFDEDAVGKDPANDEPLFEQIVENDNGPGQPPGQVRTCGLPAKHIKGTDNSNGHAQNPI